jgi:hypothetical protein
MIAIVTCCLKHGDMVMHDRGLNPNQCRVIVPATRHELQGWIPDELIEAIAPHSNWSALDNNRWADLEWLVKRARQRMEARG